MGNCLFYVWQTHISIHYSLHLCHSHSRLDRKRGEWPELFPALFRFAGHANASVRQSAFSVFHQLADVVGGELFDPYMSVVKTVLEKGLADSATGVVLAAVQATSAFLSVIDRDDATNMNAFRTLLPAMMAFLKSSVEQGRNDDAQATLEVFVDISDACPAFFRPSLRSFVVTIGTICRAAALPFGLFYLTALPR